MRIQKNFCAEAPFIQVPINCGFRTAQDFPFALSNPVVTCGLVESLQKCFCSSSHENKLREKSALKMAIRRIHGRSYAI
jgi:hypothetical protein